MSVLSIDGLRAEVAGREVLRGIDLEVRSGEVHAVMGPNGAGKSTLGNVLMGHPGYRVLGGSVSIDGVDLLGLPAWRRAQAGLFLARQDPTEVPGVPVADLLAEALLAAGRTSEAARPGLCELVRGEAAAIGLAEGFLDRGVNVDASGGEKKRVETLQLAVLRPLFAILDELDSGLDVDALRAVSRRIELATNATSGVADTLPGPDGRPGAVAAAGPPLGVLAITHYRRLLEELRPDVVHVLVDGRIVASGGPELAEQIEDTGYALHAG